MALGSHCHLDVVGPEKVSRFEQGKVTSCVRHVNVNKVILFTGLSAVVVSSACGSKTIAPDIYGSGIRGFHSSVSLSESPSLNHRAMGPPEVVGFHIDRFFFLSNKLG